MILIVVWIVTRHTPYRSRFRYGVLSWTRAGRYTRPWAIRYRIRTMTHARYDGALGTNVCALTHRFTRVVRVRTRCTCEDAHAIIDMSQTTCDETTNKGREMRDVYAIPENELIDLYHASMKHCAQVVIDNHDGYDDSQDYTESAIDIMSILNRAYRDTDTGDVPFVTLRDTFRRMFTASLDDYDNHPYNAFASDAVPSEWDAFILHPFA